MLTVSSDGSNEQLTSSISYLLTLTTNFLIGFDWPEDEDPDDDAD